MFLKKDSMWNSVPSKKRFVTWRVGRQVGDNFYWGGIEKTCGTPMNELSYTAHHQFTQIFEGIYNGRGLDGKAFFLGAVRKKGSIFLFGDLKDFVFAQKNRGIRSGMDQKSCFQNFGCSKLSAIFSSVLTSSGRFG